MRICSAKSGAVTQSCQSTCTSCMSCMMPHQARVLSCRYEGITQKLKVGHPGTCSGPSPSQCLLQAHVGRYGTSRFTGSHQAPACLVGHRWR